MPAVLTSTPQDEVVAMEALQTKLSRDSKDAAAWSKAFQEHSSTRMAFDGPVHVPDDESQNATPQKPRTSSRQGQEGSQAIQTLAGWAETRPGSQQKALETLRQNAILNPAVLLTRSLFDAAGALLGSAQPGTRLHQVLSQIEQHVSEGRMQNRAPLEARLSTLGVERPAEFLRAPLAASFDAIRALSLLPAQGEVLPYEAPTAQSSFDCGAADDYGHPTVDPLFETLAPFCAGPYADERLETLSAVLEKLEAAPDEETREALKEELAGLGFDAEEVELLASAPDEALDMLRGIRGGKLEQVIGALEMVAASGGARRELMLKQLEAQGVEDPDRLLASPLDEALDVLISMTEDGATLNEVLRLFKNYAESLGQDGRAAVWQKLERFGIFPDPRLMLKLPVEQVLGLFSMLAGRSGGEGYPPFSLDLRRQIAALADRSPPEQREVAFARLRVLTQIDDRALLERFAERAGKEPDFAALKSQLQNVLDTRAADRAAEHAMVREWGVAEPRILISKFGAEKARSRLEGLIANWFRFMVPELARQQHRRQLLNANADLRRVIDLEAFVERAGPGADLAHLYALLADLPRMSRMMHTLYREELQRYWGILDPLKLAFMLGLTPPPRRPVRLHVKAPRLRMHNQDYHSGVDIDLLELI